jgi:hypothetical protein
MMIAHQFGREHAQCNYFQCNYFELQPAAKRPIIKAVSGKARHGEMSKRDKLIARLKRKPRDFSWDELTRLLEMLGYREAAAGKTGGSRRRYIHDTAPTIALHKPHPNPIVKSYVIEDVVRLLTEEGLI